MVKTKDSHENRRQESGGRSQEAGVRRQEAGVRRQEAGVRRQESMKAGVNEGRRQESGGRLRGISQSHSGDGICYNIKLEVIAAIVL
jgi:hypothetical protein